MSAQDDLVKQILGQGNTSKWSGAGWGSAEANAADMAKILAGIGITDIKQLGKVPTYKNVAPVGELYNGLRVQNAYYDDGTFAYKYITESDGYDGDGAPRSRVVPIPKDAKLSTAYGETHTDPETGWTTDTVLADDSNVIKKDGQLLIKTGETFGNKETGQAVPNTYSERQRGNFFGGTFAGKGNTGYGVQFGPDGTPYFYTQGASSSDIGDIAPLLAVASFIPGVAPFAQAINAAIAIDQGNPLGAIAGLAGLGDLAGVSGAADVANAARMGSALQSGDPLAILMSGANVGGVTDIGGVNLGDVSKGIGAVKAIQSGDPLAMLRYGMGALPKDGGLTSNLGPGTPEEFSEGLIPGYFQPGGEGYIAPTETATGPGYYDEITGKFISDENGGLQGPLGPETGNFDPNQKWEYSLTKPGVWTNDSGEEIDLSYMPDRDTAMTGKELMERAGAMPGGAKAPTVKAPTGAPAKTSGSVGSALAGAAGATGLGASQGQSAYDALLNLMSSNNQLAHIKSNEDLFGSGIFSSPQKPAPESRNEEQANSSETEQDSATDSLFSGGYVDDIDVDTLMRILRS